MPTTLDELAAAATVSKAMADGRDVRGLTREEYQRVRADFIASVEAGRMRAADAAEIARLTQKYAKSGLALGKSPT